MEADKGPGLSAVQQFWKGFDLNGKRSHLDKTGVGITEAHEKSTQRRRHLAESTQQFRLNTDKAIITAVGPLLKKYQQEIDTLTERAKNGEKAFLGLYQALYEAPDPAKAMETALSMVSKIPELETKVRRQARELAEYTAESKEIRNQHTTIIRLEEKIRQLEQQLQAKYISRDMVRKEVADECTEQFSRRENEWEKKFVEQTSKLEAARRLHQESQDQLLAIQTKNDELKARQSTELELVMAELERSQSRILELEKELKVAISLQNQSQNASRSPTHENDDHTKQLHSMLDQKDKDMTTLQHQLEREDRIHHEAQETASNRITQLETFLQEKEDAMTLMEEQLTQRPTFEDLEQLKQQIRIYQAVEYNDAEGIIKESLSKAESIENLLIKKNKNLEHQLTGEKLKQTQLQEQLEQHQVTLKETREQLGRSIELVGRLEEDVVAAQSSSRAQSVDHVSQTEDASAESGGGSLGTVFRNQRDRLKQRTQELETKLSNAEKRHQSIKAEADAVAADNVSLVERLRYLQGYRKESAAKLDVESGIAAEHKYTKEYEDRMNPFQEFRGRQRERRRRELNLVDRTVLIFGDLIFGYKYARVFLCLYIMILHIVFMAMLAVFSERRHNGGLSTSDIYHLCEARGFSSAP